MNKLQEKHAKELSELKRAKEVEVQMLSNRLLERTEACSALSCQLKERRRWAELRESKIRSQAAEEISRIEKTVHQEKVSQLC